MWDTNEEDDDVHRLGVDDACSDRCDVSAECRIESVVRGEESQQPVEYGGGMAPVVCGVCGVRWHL